MLMTLVLVHQIRGLLDRIRQGIDMLDSWILTMRIQRNERRMRLVCVRDEVARKVVLLEYKPSSTLWHWAHQILTPSLTLSALGRF